MLKSSLSTKSKQAAEDNKLSQVDPLQPVEPSFEDKVSQFEQQQQDRRFFNERPGQVEEVTVRQDVIQETLPAMQELEASLVTPKFKEFTPEEVKRIQEGQLQDQQRRLQLQKANEDRRAKRRRDQAREQHMNGFAAEIKRLNKMMDNREINADQWLRGRGLLNRQFDDEFNRKYKEPDFVNEGRVYNPFEFRHVPLYNNPEENIQIGEMRVNTRHYIDNDMLLPERMYQSEIGDKKFEVQNGEVLYFDGRETPTQVFEYLNANGDGTRMAQAAKSLSELEILHTRDMSSGERVMASLGYITERTGKAFADAIPSVLSAIDDWMFVPIQERAFRGTGIEAKGLAHLWGGDERVDWLADIEEQRPVLYDSFLTDVGVGLGEALPGFLATIGVAAATRNPFAVAGTAEATGLVRLASFGSKLTRNMYSGTRGVIAQSMPYLVNKLRSEQRYIDMGLTPEQAKQNAAADIVAGVISVAGSNKLMAGLNSFAMKQPFFRKAMLKFAKYKVPYFLTKGATREALQESFDEAFHNALKASLDRADFFGEREDGDFLIGARELLIAASVGGILGAAGGGTIDAYSVINALDTEFLKDTVPGVGDRAVFHDGTPMRMVDEDKTYIRDTPRDTDVEIQLNEVDPKSPQGLTYEQTGRYRNGRIAKVTVSNFSQFEREWKNHYYRHMVQNEVEHRPVNERRNNLVRAFDSLRAFSEGKGVDPEMFGDPNTEIYEGAGRANGQRKIDLASADAELAYALAGKSLPDVRLGESSVESGVRKYKPLKGTSRADFRKAGLSRFVKGMNQEQRETFVRKAKESVERLNVRISLQDALAEQALTAAEDRPTATYDRDIAKIQKDAKVTAKNFIRSNDSARFWLGMRSKSKQAIMGPSTPFEGMAVPEIVALAADQMVAQQVSDSVSDDEQVGQPTHLDKDSRFFGTKPSPEAVSILENVLTNYRGMGLVTGEVVAPPSEAAAELVESMRIAGTSVVFVESMATEAVRDRSTGIIIVNAAEFENDPNSVISAVLSHEFVHNLQFYHPKKYKALVKGLKSINPDMLTDGAKEYMFRLAQSEAVRQGVELPRQSFTDAEVVQFIQDNPQIALEIVPYAVTQLVEAADGDMNKALARAFSGMGRGKLGRFISKIRAFASALRGGQNVSQAWTSASAWDQLLLAFESAAFEYRTEMPAAAELTPEQIAKQPRRARPKQGSGPPLPVDSEPQVDVEEVSLGESNTVDEAIFAAAELADTNDSLESVSRAMSEAAGDNFVSRDPRVEEGTSASVFAQGGAAALQRQQRADIFDRMTARTGSISQRMLAANLKAKGESALKRAKTAVESRKPQESIKGIVQEHALAAEAAVHLQGKEPTKIEIIKQMVADMMVEDPEGYAGIMPAMIRRYAALGLTQPEAERIANEARQKRFISEDEGVFGDQTGIDAQIEDAIGESYQPSESAEAYNQIDEDIEARFDRLFDASLSTSPRPYVTENEYKQLRREFDIGAAVTGTFEEDFDADYERVALIESSAKPLTMYSTFEELLQESDHPLFDDVPGVVVEVLVDDKPLRISVKEDGDMQFTYGDNESLQMQSHKDLRKVKAIMGTVERVAGRLAELGAFRTGASLQIADGSTGRAKRYAQFMMALGSRINQELPLGEHLGFVQKGNKLFLDPVFMTRTDVMGDGATNSIYMRALDMDIEERFALDLAEDLADAHKRIFAAFESAEITFLDAINQLNEEVAAVQQSQLSRLKNRDDIDIQQKVLSPLNILYRATPPIPTDFAARQYADVDFDASMLTGKKMLNAFRSRGDLPAAVFERKFFKDSKMRAAADDITFRSNQLKKAIKKAKVDDEAGLLATVDLALKDKNGAAMKKLKTDFPEVAIQVMTMRQKIDDMTGQLKRDGAFAGLNVDVDSNLGTYVHRSYRIFDDPDYARNVPKDVRNAMKMHLTNVDGMTPLEAEVAIQGFLEVGDAAGPLQMMSSGKTLPRDILKKRNEGLPEPLRMLWGEYKDPYVNYAKSMQKMAALSTSIQFAKEIAEAGQVEGAGQFLSATAKEGFEHKFPDDKLRYGALAGMYAKPEFAEAYEAQYKPEFFTGEFGAIYAYGVSAAKWGKTVGNPQTHVRNTIGNILFAIANGHFNPAALAMPMKKVFDSSPVIVAMRGGDVEAAQREYNKLAKLGVVQAGSVRDVYALIEESKELTIPQFLKKLMDNKAARFMKKGVEGTIDAANRAYTFEDDAWKIFAFHYEKARYEKAYGGTLPDTFPNDARNLDEHIATIIRDTYPNYTMPPKIIRVLRRTPLVGTFVSFPAEVIRTGIQRAKITAQEIKSDNPQIRRIGYARAVSQVIAHSFSVWMMKAVHAMLGTSPEEVEAMRELVAPWSQNSPLIVWRGQDGKYNYIDLGYTDPFSMFTKAFYGFMRGETFQEGLFGSTDGFQKGLVEEILSPFISEDMVFGSLLDIYRGRTDTDRPIYSRGDARLTKLRKMAEHFFGDLQPGFIKNMITVPYKALAGITDDYGKVFDLPTHLVSQATGFNLKSIDPQQALMFKARLYARMEQELRNEMSKVAGRAGTVSEGELFNTYEEVNAAREQLLMGFRGVLLTGESMGIKRGEMFKILKDAGVAQKRIPALLNHTHVPMTIDTDMLSRYFKKAGPDTPLRATGEMRKRMIALRTAEREARKKAKESR